MSAAEAIASYQKVLKLDPDYAPAHINLGTLYYNQSDYEQAEAHYRKAIEADPRYALAYFDLGNVLDETQRVEEAIAAYKVCAAAGSHLRGRALQPGACLRALPAAAPCPPALARLPQTG